MAVSEAQKRATAKYEKERYDKILTRFPKGTKERILETGAQSVNRFIIEAVNEKLERMDWEPGTEPIEEYLTKDLGEDLTASGKKAEAVIEKEEPEPETRAFNWSRLPMTEEQVESCAKSIGSGEIPFYFIDQIHMRNEMGEENFGRVYETVNRMKK